MNDIEEKQQQKELQQFKDVAKILDHQFINSGGGIMVSVFTVWHYGLKQVVFASVDEESFIISTVNDLLYDASDLIDIEGYQQLLNVSYSDLVEGRKPNEYDALVTYCRFEYLKKLCVHYKQTVCVPYHQLPTRLKESYDTMCFVQDTSVLVETNGYEVLIDNPDTIKLQQLHRYMTSTVEFVLSKSHDASELESMRVIIGFGDQIISIGSTADTYKALLKCVERLLSVN